eukprot:12162916-Alexandrium_andersonii.AAC.1
MGSNPLLRRCGWAWVQVDLEARPVSEAFGWCGHGGLEGPVQTVPRAEMVACIDALAYASGAGGDIVIYTDHANLVEGFSQGRDAHHLENGDLWD